MSPGTCHPCTGSPPGPAVHLSQSQPSPTPYLRPPGSASRAALTPAHVCTQTSRCTAARTRPPHGHTPPLGLTPPHTHTARTHPCSSPPLHPGGAPVPWFPLLPDLAEPGPMLGYPPPHVFHTPRHQRWGFREAPPGSCQVDLYGPPVPTAPLPCDLEKHLASPSLYFFICQMGAHGGRPHGGGAPSRARMVQNAWVL